MMGLTSQSATDALAGMWTALGYRPERSLVVAMLAERRVPLVVRVDLADAAGDPAALAEIIATAAARAGATACVIAAVDDDQAPSGGTRARRIGEDVAAALTLTGITCHDVLTVGAASFAGRDTGQIPLEALDSTAAAAARVYAGGVLARGRDDLVADVLPIAAPHLVASSPRPPARDVLVRWLRDLSDSASSPSGPEDLLSVLNDPRSRDAVLLAAASSSITDPDALLAVSGDVLPVLLAATPDHEHVTRATSLLATLAREAIAPGPVLAVLAWLAWWTGNGPRSDLLATRALQADPHHRLARIAAQLIRTQTPPPWVSTTR